jgi:hypothetical protein
VFIFWFVLCNTARPCSLDVFSVNVSFHGEGQKINSWDTFRVSTFWSEHLFGPVSFSDVHFFLSAFCG